MGYRLLNGKGLRHIFSNNCIDITLYESVLMLTCLQDNLTRQLAKAQGEADHWRHKYEKDGMAKVSCPPQQNTIYSL